MTLVLLHTWILITLTWVYASLKKDVSIVDSIYSWIFILACWTYTYQISFSLSSIILNTMITLWGVRLSIHITIKNWGLPEDKRYQSFRQYYGAQRYWWFSYFQVFLLQWLFALTFLMPIHIHYLLPSSINLNLFSLIGMFLFVFGFCYEAIADYQLLKFKKIAPKHQALQSGLWHYSRHPNYFGEIVLWYGITIYVISLNTTPIGLIALIGPLFLNYTISQLSGPHLQAKHLKKTYSNYSDYYKKTPTIIPSWVYLIKR